MPPDSHSSAQTAVQGTTGPADKVRLRFCKEGPLRWLSHHDLLRTFERMLRRSALPVRATQGFNPHPRIVFALSLPLGVVGRAEVVELELDEQLPPQEVRSRLEAQCPPGLSILEARRISPRASALVVGFRYALAVPASRSLATQERLATILREPSWWVERTKPTHKRLDIRSFVRDIRIDSTGWLEMDLYLTPQGTARPEELLALLQLSDALEQGCVLERTHLDIQDESTSPPPALSNGQCGVEGQL